jgi:hypothetical protein
MTREEVKKTFEKHLKDFGGIFKDYEKMAEKFIDGLPIPLDDIEKLYNFYAWNQDENECDVEILVITKGNKFDFVINFYYTIE